MLDFQATFWQIRWQDLLDIALVSYVIYKILVLLKGTRAMQMLVGLGVVLLTFAISQELNLAVTQWMIRSFLSSLVLAVIILFQSDIRKALARMGSGRLFANKEESETVQEEISRAAVNLASRMTGALIVIERGIGLGDIIENAAKLDATVSRELLIQIFQTSGPLHDGAVVISENRLVAAKALLPLSGSQALAKNLGTRHRAAVGISEETDAIAVVVSEERGRVSVAEGGMLHQDMDSVALRKLLGQLLQTEAKPGFFSRLLNREKEKANA